MWCKHCRQDVPAIASAEVSAAGLGAPSTRAGDYDENATRYLCTQCGEPIGSVPSQWTNVSDLGIDLGELSLSGGPAELPLPRGSASTARRPDAAVRFDTWQWELDQELHDVRRLLTRRGAAPAELKQPIENPRQDLQPVLSVPTVEKLMSPPVVARAVTEKSLSPPRPRAWAPVAWLILMLGLTATCCGGALLGWSVLSGRDELWSQGVPILIGGQVALFVALVAMLLRLGRQSQLTAVRLHDLDSQLASLSHSTQIPQSSTAHQPFYVHLAEGAHPQALLSDMRNQLDLLAISMSRRNT
ncbi:MAG: hypothetical protein K8T91_18385 [Planctomycetes bacterium]|nr:hypothetical protein [Planctomycetota bacterium]